MKAGRELDALIAVKIMGFEKTYQDCGLMGTHLVERNGQSWSIPEPIPNYSTNIADAWLVVEKLDKDRKFLYVSNVASGWKCDIEAGRWYAIAETAPLAICLAALKACGVEVEG